MTKKKLLLMILVLSLLITGCSKTNDKKASTDQSKGRYVESNLSLPKDFDKNTVLQLTKKEGMPFLYSFTSDKKLTITGYQMNADGTWSEDTPEWLKSVSIKSTYNYMNKVLADGKGNQYLYFVELINDSFKGNLLRSSDGITYETLHPEGWDEKTEEGYYHAPDKVAVFNDGSFVSYFGGEITFYHSETMKKEHTITDREYMDSTILASNQYLYISKNDSANYLKSIDVFDTANVYSKTVYPFQSKIIGNTLLDVNDKNDLILCNTEGIHLLDEGTSIWQTIVDGSLTSLNMQSLWSSGFVSDSRGNYYVLYNSDTGYSFKKYTYDKTMDSVPSTELSIYSLQDNSTIRQAAAIFQQKHPDVRVNFTTAMTPEEYETADVAIKEDYIKALNTELLAGRGTDILILDGLPADSLIEKGVLADMSDIIKPMLDSGELFPNIINAYSKNDQIYRVPVRFSIPLLFGRKNDAMQLTTLEALANYNSQHTTASLIGNLTLNDFLSVFSPYLTSKIMIEDGEIDKEKLTAVLTNLKTIADNCGIVDEYTEEMGSGNNIWNLASNIELSIKTCNGFNDSMFPMGVVTYVNGCYTPFENSFIPECEIGINNNSKQKDLCKEFISLVLSEEIGKNDFYDGFSINKKALKTCSQLDRSDYEASSEIENADGTYSAITFQALNQNQLDDLMNTCSTVSIKAVCDEQVITAFLEETKEFFNDNLSVEETADHIIKKTSIYLSE